MERIRSRAELMRRLKPGIKLKIVQVLRNPAALDRVNTIRKVQTNDIVFEPPEPGGSPRWQAIPPPAALRFTENGFAVYDYTRNKSDRYVSVENGELLIAYEFVEQQEAKT